MLLLSPLPPMFQADGYDVSLLSFPTHRFVTPPRVASRYTRDLHHQAEMQRLYLESKVIMLKPF